MRRDEILDSSAMSAEVGDVLVLLQDLEGMLAGFYAVQSIEDDWAILRIVIDDARTERLTVTGQTVPIPLPLLELFMPVGLQVQLSSPKQSGSAWH